MVTLKQLGHSAVDILKAPAKKGLGALAPALAIFFGRVGEYRPLTTEQRAEAEKIFGTSVELDKVRIAVKSRPVDMLQRAFKGRPFTTMYLINSASWAEVEMPTLIHELTHVWQSLVAGPIYMIEALHAEYLGEGYNYGHDDTPEGRRRGDGAEARLIAADGNFDAFNREQQATIIQHYYVRRHKDEPASDYTAWQPYANAVKS